MNEYIRRAQMLMQQGRYELAEEQLRLALGEESEHHFAHALFTFFPQKLMARVEIDRVGKLGETSVGLQPCWVEPAD